MRIQAMTMKNKIKIIIIIFYFTLLNIDIVEAQLKHKLVPEDYQFKNDSAKIYYKFFPGDTLYYKSFSIDSIIINFESALTKIRTENYKIWCDSHIGDTLYHITIQMTNFNGTEKILNKDSIVKRQSDWLERKIMLGIDSTGERKYYNDHN